MEPTESKECEPSAITLIGAFELFAYPGMDAVGPNGERPMPLVKEYTFAASTYKMIGYPELVITGAYTVVSQDGLTWKVQFTDTIFDGTPQDDQEREIRFEDPCGKTFVMNGESYRRLPPTP